MQQFLSITIQVFKFFYFFTTHFQSFNEEKLANKLTHCYKFQYIFDDINQKNSLNFT